jgi:hypothetical protein
MQVEKSPAGARRSLPHPSALRVSTLPPAPPQQMLLKVLTVGFSHRRCPSGNRTSSIWMGRDAEDKSSVISIELSVTTARKAIADSGQLIPNP